jgi:hypothetical protein
MTTTNIASKTVTEDPWQLRILIGESPLQVMTKENAVDIVPANDANDLFTGRQPPQFLPRFLSVPDGMEWS